MGGGETADAMQLASTIVLLLDYAACSRGVGGRPRWSRPCITLAQPPPPRKRKPIRMHSFVHVLTLFSFTACVSVSS
eukprot:3923011-Prymnesium_polylepis.1